MRYLFVILTISLAMTGCGDGPRTPLGKAAAYGTTADLKSLLAEARADEIQSALITAARFGNRPAIRTLVDAGANPNQPAGVNSWPPLMHAIHKNRPAAVKELLNAGADVNYIGSNGGTALTMAAGYGYADIVQVLLAKGADPSLHMNDGFTALALAIMGVPDIDRFTVGKCQAETVRLLLEHSPELAAQRSILARLISRVGNCGEIRNLSAEDP
jgi:ankyrin repeat protein